MRRCTAYAEAMEKARLVDEAEKGAAVAGKVIGSLLYMCLAPFASIWALNTVFHMGIPVTFWTWLAFVWLHGRVKGRACQCGKPES